MPQQPVMSRDGRITVDGEPYTNRSTVVAAIDAGYERLTPNNAALLLIDYQVAPLWELSFADTRRLVAALALASHEMRVPIIITSIGPEVWGGVIPELSAGVGDVPHIVRTEVNAWDNSAVRDTIHATRRKKLIIAGGAAPVAVALCALSAAQAGFDVYTPIDASAQFSHAAITRLSRDGVIVTTSALVLAELAREDEPRQPRRRRY
jgi:nicotinamidase-related amidase